MFSDEHIRRANRGLIHSAVLFAGGLALFALGYLLDPNEDDALDVWSDQ